MDVGKRYSELHLLQTLVYQLTAEQILLKLARWWGGHRILS